MIDGQSTCAVSTLIRIHLDSGDGLGGVTILVNDTPRTASFAGPTFTDLTPLAADSNVQPTTEGVHIECAMPGYPAPAGALPLPGHRAVAVQADTLPFTGAHTGPLVGLGVALVVLGVLVMRAARKRATHTYGPSMSTAWD